MDNITAEKIKQLKNKRKLSMVTCYDYTFAAILDQTKLDMVLVGDSLANVLLGMEETRKVSLSEMLNHTKAVAKGINQALVVADIPYVAYQKNPLKAEYQIKKFITAGARAVKLEWFDGRPGRNCEYVVKKIVKAKIPVMGHIGLTPQTAHLLGGFKVQGRTSESAQRLIKQAKILENLGVFSVLLECVPQNLALEITKKIKVPTIGIGAGMHCDGQVLVLYDLLGLYKKSQPRFVRVYKDLAKETKQAVDSFIQDVAAARFPAANEAY